MVRLSASGNQPSPPQPPGPALPIPEPNKKSDGTIFHLIRRSRHPSRHHPPTAYRHDARHDGTHDQQRPARWLGHDVELEVRPEVALAPAETIRGGIGVAAAEARLAVSDARCPGD